MHLEVAKIVMNRIDFRRSCPPSTYGILEVTILQKAQQQGRENIIKFLRDNSYCRDPKFTTWS